jgi:hypothetical protein
MGKDVEKAAIEQKSLAKYAKIKFAFEFAKDPDGSWEDKKSFANFLSVLTQRLHKKYKASDPAEFHGYKLRKQYSLGSGIEVLADLDAKDYDEFRKKYKGIQGAIDILLSTKKVMSGGTKDPARDVSKLIRKLEIEAEDED